MIKGRKNSLPLISKNTLMDLGMRQIRKDGSFATPNDIRIPEAISSIHAVDKQGMSNQTFQAITRKFSNIFEGIGKIKKTKNSMFSST